MNFYERAKDRADFIIMAVLMALILIGSAHGAIDDVVITDMKVRVNGNTGTFDTFYVLENPTGSGDMTDFSLIETQILDSRGNFLALVGGQEVCDPKHPENTHRDYFIEDGGLQPVVFSSPELPSGTYRIRCLTASGCFADEGSQWVREGPCAEGLDVDTVTINRETGQVDHNYRFEATEDVNGLATLDLDARAKMKIFWKPLIAGALIALIGFSLMGWQPVLAWIILIFGLLLISVGIGFSTGWI